MPARAADLENPTNGRKALADATLLQKAAKIKKAAAEEMADADAMLEAAAPIETFEPAPEDTQEEPAGKRRIDEILAELEGEGSFEIYHIQNGEDVKVGQYDISDYPHRLEYVAKQKSGGQFKVRFRDNKGKHAGQLTRSFDSETYRNIAASNPGGAVDMLRFMEMMAQERRDSEARREESERRFQLQMEKVRSENQALTLKMIEALGSKSTTPATSLTEIAGVMKVIQGMTPQQPNPLSSVRELLEAVSLLREDNEVEVAPAWSKALDKAFSVLRPFVEASAAKMAASLQPPQATGAGTPRLLPGASGPAAPSTSTVPQSPAPVSANPLIKEYAARLYEAAAGGLKSGTVASFIADAVSHSENPADKQTLIDFAGDENSVSEMIKVEPRLVPFKEWLENFAGELLDLLDPEEVVEVKTPEAIPVKGALEGADTAT